MIRQLQYKIEEQHQGKSIAAFLKEKEFSRAVLIALKKDTSGIRKNGVWAGVNESLSAGDVLSISLKEDGASLKIIPIKRALDILYEDEDILVINKPYDMPIHPSVNNYENTLANAVLYYFKEQAISSVFRCINRLDRDTTGVTIIAKNLISASILSKKLQDRQVSRVYIAFVEGITEEERTIDLPIGRMEGTVLKRKIDFKEGKRAVTHCRRLDVFYVNDRPVSVVALKLDTGRTHQIRVHMTAIGHPLLGDFLYNEDSHILTRQALHAAECCFNHPLTGEYIKIVAPFYEDMKRLMECSTGEMDRLDYLESSLEQLKWT